MTQISLSAYAAEVAELAKNGTHKRIPNSGDAHAAIVFENLFLNASKTVDIYSGQFRQSFFGSPNLIAAAQSFLNNANAKLRILLEFPCSNILSNTFIHAFWNQFQAGQIEIGTLKSGANFSSRHFCVADNKSYRIETNDKTTTAVVNFNEPDIALPLAQHFSREFPNSVLQLPQQVNLANMTTMPVQKVAANLAPVV